MSDVSPWRGSPAAWAEDLTQVVHLNERSPSQVEAAKLSRLGDDPVVVELSGSGGEVLTVAAAGAERGALLGPFAPSRSTAAEEAPRSS